MNTRFKLEEARYFLMQLEKELTTPKINTFNLSAFLSSWRSVHDVLLIDLANYFGLLEYWRNNLQGIVFDDKAFWCAANALKNSEALKFHEWWKTKKKVLENSPLYNDRNMAIHFGLTPLPSYAYGSIPSPFLEYIQGRTVRAKNSGLLEECQKGYSLVEDIVDEVEKRFCVDLS